MSFAEANKQYFDIIADAYDKKPWFQKVNLQTTEFLRSHLDWIGIPPVEATSSTSSDAVRLLDYACGPGLMSRIFGPYVTVTRGIDIAPNMVAEYNARARSAGLPTSQINAVVGDLFSEPDADKLDLPEFHNFDLATVGFGFHHFEDVSHSARCLKQRLKPGGVLVITDFLEGGDLLADEDGNPIPGTEGDHTGHVHHHHHSDHGHGHHHSHEHSRDHTNDLINHHESGDMLSTRPEVMKASIVVPSFTIEGVRRFFGEAGFVDVDVLTMSERVYMQFAGRKIWRTILFAKGRRPEARDKSEL